MILDGAVIRISLAHYCMPVTVSLTLLSYLVKIDMKLRICLLYIDYFKYFL